MLYNGALDLSCNHLGIMHALEANTWHGRYAPNGCRLICGFPFESLSLPSALSLSLLLNRPWKDASRSLTKFKKDVMGDHYSLDNLSLFIVRKAGDASPPPSSPLLLCSCCLL
jgi:hypothetical protein